MKHSPRGSVATPSLVTVAVAATMAAACGDRTGGTGDSTAAVGSAATGVAIDGCAISSDSIRRLTRRAFVRWARGIDYDPAADSQGRPHGVATAGITVHRTRGMNRATREDLEDGCLIARVRSTTADTSLGLGAGWNFVWADSTNPYTAVIVPDDSSVAVTQFEMGLWPSEPDPVTITTPRYICSDCGRDWCVYPRSGLSSEPALFQPEGTGLREVPVPGPLALGSPARSP